LKIAIGLETVEILMEAERHFGITIPDPSASNCLTVAELQKLILRLLADKGTPPSTDLAEQVLRDLVCISAEVTGDDPSRITPESRSVGDVTKYG
jgi:hypothetical protein